MFSQTHNNLFSQFTAYMQKVFFLPDLITEIQGKRKGKQKYDELVLTSFLVSFFCGATSLNAISKEFKNNNYGQTLSRSVLEDFLKIEQLPYQLRKYIKAMIKKMKKGKMINLDNVMGKVIASVDGIEIFRTTYTPTAFYNAIQTGKICKFCQIVVHRDKKTGEITSYETYHRLVIICLITNRGPMPFQWAFQESNGYKRYAKWLTSESMKKNVPHNEIDGGKVKQEGELTVLHSLLDELYDEFDGRLPFDVLIGDGLYDKAPVIDKVEKYGASLIAVHKNKSRTLHEQAKEDFTTCNPFFVWREDQKSYEGWYKTYEDPNREESKKVRIVRVIREQNGKEPVDNYFYCSNERWIRPRFVEWCRHYRWKEENGFNAWRVTKVWERRTVCGEHETFCMNPAGNDPAQLGLTSDWKRVLGSSKVTLLSSVDSECIDDAIELRNESKNVGAWSVHA